MKKGKKFKEALGKVDRDKIYSPVEALKILKEVSFTKFDETVELHIRLGIDSKQASQQVRGSVSLPHGTGKTIRVVVFAQGDKAKEAQEAGADQVGAADLIEKIEKGWLEFEAAVATPDLMKIVSKLGKVLGPRGLMPNPKIGTVTMDVGKVVSELKKGKVEYRTDKFGIIHLPLGKVSFDLKKLLENYVVVLDEIVKVKPSAAKGRYLRSVTLTTTMGPGIKIDSSKIKEWLEEAV
ncbi:MAG: 50S ribosomal protein L1 [Actinomycetia bacterium]|nr:50S ribosomal protein L1 [Actinomycetes bacterium]